MRALSAEAFAEESGATTEVIERLVEVGAIEPLPDGRFDARDGAVASTVGAMLEAGIPLDDLAWALESGRFGIRSLGHIFSEPSPRTTERYADLIVPLGDAASVLPAVYAALGIPEPEPDDHPRVDEIELLTGFVSLWTSVDPTGQANIRVARQIGDATRRIAEVWLDVWDEVARPDATTQGAPTVGAHARPLTRPTPARTSRSGWRSWADVSFPSSTNGRSRGRSTAESSMPSNACCSRAVTCRPVWCGRRPSPSSTLPTSRR